MQKDKETIVWDIYEELFEEKIDGAHRSLTDVEATAEIINWYYKEGHL